MNLRLILQNFPQDEQTLWEEKVLSSAEKSEAIHYVFTKTEIEINHYIIQEKYDLVICYLLPNRKPNKEFWRYLTSSLRIPVILVRRNPEPNEIDFFDYGIEDIFDLNKIENQVLCKLIQKVWRRSQVRRREFHILKLEAEGIILRDPVILIVEDDTDLLESIKVTLQKHGYIIYTAQTASEALMLFAEHKPDIVLCDYYLPDKTAENFLNQIGLNRQGHDVVFLIMSGESNSNWRLNILHEVEDILTKPVNFQELEIKIRKALQRNLYIQKLHNQLQQLQTQKKIAERYISTEIMQRFEDGEFSSESQGHIQIATILFFDLRNSTQLGNTIEPKKFSEILNSILHDVMDLAVTNNGSINKMLGDGLLISFGAPDPRRGNPNDAVKFALRTKEHFQMLNEVDAFMLGHAINFGIGIATGDVFAGHIGSIHRMEFTLMGNVVNTASRLESMNKKTLTNILIDNETYTALVEEQKPNFKKFRVAIRGKGNTGYTVWGNI